MTKQEEIRKGIAQIIKNPLDFTEDLTAEFVPEYHIPLLIVKYLHSQMGKYRCPHCGAEYTYQPDYRCCIVCETYLDYFWEIQPLIEAN